MKQIQVNLSHKEIKEIVKEYTTITNDVDDDYMLTIKQTLLSIDKADLIVFCLYTHLQSERKTAELLGVSRTPIHSLVMDVKNKILNNLEKLK